MLKNKTVVITGGSSGIGRGVALAAARHNAGRVIIADIREDAKEGGPTTAALLATSGTPAVFLKTDVTQEYDIVALLDMADTLGGVDLMVCNAGINAANDGVDLPPEDFARMISINLAGVLSSAQEAARRMKARGKGGSIVLISSIAGTRGNALTVGYSATKGGVNQLAASLACALGPAGIRVNAISPGLIDTRLADSHPALVSGLNALRDRMPLGRFGHPEEVGDAVAWLGSNSSSFVTGIVLPVDGGQLAAI